MPNFESPISNKKIAGGTMRTFEVPDESGQEEYSQQYVRMDEESIRNFQNQMNQQYVSQAQARSPAEIEKEIREARLAKAKGKEKISEGAKKRIELLIGMTRLTREAEIEGNTFILRTLKSKEMREAMISVIPFDGTVQAPYEIRCQLLARSLTHVAGVEIDQFIGSDKLEDKLLFLEELDDSLLTRLYNEYVILVEASKNKYSVKNEEDVKEVLEDLKK